MTSLLGHVMGAIGPWDLNAVSAQPQYNNMTDEQYQALTNIGEDMIKGGVKNDNWFAPTIGQHYLGMASLGRQNRENTVADSIARNQEALRVLNTRPGEAPPGTIAPSPVQTGAVAPSGKMATIKTEGGAAFQVAPQYEANFKGLIDDLSAAGYSIDPLSSGGYANRTIKDKSGRDTGIPSKHASGGAIDINWNANPVGGRPVSQRGFTGKGSQPIDPILARQLAAKHGLVWGGDFKNNPDPMHFEAPGDFNRTGRMAAAPVQQQQRQTQEAPQAPPVAAGGQVAATPPEVPPPQDGAPATTGGLSGRITDPGIETPQPQPPQQVAQAPPNRDDPRFVAQGPPGSGLKVPMAPTMGDMDMLQTFMRYSGLSPDKKAELYQKFIASHGPQTIDGYGGKLMTDPHTGQVYHIPGAGTDSMYGNVPGKQGFTPDLKPYSRVTLPEINDSGVAGAPQTAQDRQSKIDRLGELNMQLGEATGAGKAGEANAIKGAAQVGDMLHARFDSERALSQEMKVFNNINEAAKEGKLPGLRGAWRDKVYEAAKIFESLTGKHIDRLAGKETLATNDLIGMFQAEGLSREARSLASQIIAQNKKQPNFDDTVEGMRMKTEWLMKIHEYNIKLGKKVQDWTNNGRTPISATELHSRLGDYMEYERKLEDAQEAAEKAAKPGPKSGTYTYKGKPVTVEPLGR